MPRTCLSTILLGLVMCGFIGCGSASPELAVVKGRVLLDGQPAANLQLTFEPQAAGSGKKASAPGAGSMAMTNENGEYELHYKGGGPKGALVGTHTVRISRLAGAEASAAVEKPIPAKYNSDSDLKCEVIREANVHDFNISTR